MNNSYNYNFCHFIAEDMLQETPEDPEDPGSKQLQKTVYGLTNWILL